MGRHLPYGITQCYRPPDISERAPRLNPNQYAGAPFTYPRGMEGWVDVGYPAMHQPGVELATSRSQTCQKNIRKHLKAYLYETAFMTTAYWPAAPTNRTTEAYIWRVFKFLIDWLIDWQVQRPNHYTTEPPKECCVHVQLKQHGVSLCTERSYSALFV